MSLDEWRRKNNLSYENLARTLNLTTSKVYRLCTKPSCMKLVDAYAIQRATNGEVSLLDMIPLEGDC